MPFRFVHTADIHLDSPLRSLALRDPDLAALIGGATRQAFENVIELCLEERVDALMIAGDLYDGGQTSMKTALFLAAQLKRLDDAGIRTFVVRGNHDAESKIELEPVLPECVKVFGDQGEAVEIERPRGAIPVAVHGVSFAKQHAPDSLVPKFEPSVDGAFNIGLLHTSLGGAPEHDEYAPCAVPDLVGKGFKYWCLGHVHKRKIHHENPHVVMPGMPQGRDIGEAGPKSATLVHVADDGSIACTERPVNVAQFERVPVDLSGIDDRRDMVERIGAALERERGRVDADHLVVRLELRGATPLDWRLRRDPEFARAEAEFRASGSRTWIEKIELETITEEADAPSAGPVAELAAAMSELAAEPEFGKDLADDIEKVLRRLPGSGAWDVFGATEADRTDSRRRSRGRGRDVFGATEADRTETLARLAAEGRRAVVAHLRGETVEESAE